MKAQILTATAAVCLLASSAASQSIQDCDWVASAANLVEPWSETSRTFANGDIRVAELDTGGEPACCSSHLLILSPNPEYGQACHVLSVQPGVGFSRVFTSGIESSYDPGKGILLQVSVGRFDPATGSSVSNSPMRVPVRINQATGVVKIEMLTKSGNVLKKKASN